MSWSTLLDTLMVFLKENFRKKSIFKKLTDYKEPCKLANIQAQFTCIYHLCNEKMFKRMRTANALVKSCIRIVS